MSTVIRASSLPQYSDCNRRHAARLFPVLVAENGYDLTDIPPSIGAIIGTATHEALGLVLTNRMTGAETPRDEWMARITESVSSGIADGVVWDDTTVSREAAEKQAARMALAVIQTIADDINPVAVECAFEADIGDGFLLRGHLDVLEATSIGDFKTGTVQRANQAQYGAYSLLARSNGHTVTTLREFYIKRAAASRPQPDPVVSEYSLKEAERAAWETLNHIKASVTRFRETGDSWVFLPNPNSMMCSPNYCPAYGTNFCMAHKGKIFRETSR